MKQVFTKDFIKKNSGCYTEEQLESCSFMSNSEITLESILTSDIPLKDKYWFVCKKLCTKKQNQQIAIRVAEIVLPIHENKYPNDKRPRKSIEAAKQYISGHMPLSELLEKRDAAAYAADAYADAYAADAAAAAYAAAYAAYAAAYAADAYADAYAADAAYAAYAAYADAAYAAAADIKQQLLSFILDFCLKTESV